MTQKIEKIITKYLSNIEGIAAIYMFGSLANGKANNRSDVDIAVLFTAEKVPDEFERINLQQDLSDELAKECDLIVLNEASPIVAMQVLKNGKILELKNKHIHNLYVIKAINMYDDLKRVRAVIEKNILKGKVYG